MLRLTRCHTPMQLHANWKNLSFLPVWHLVKYSEKKLLQSVCGLSVWMYMSVCICRYLYINSRAWPKGYTISDPLNPPPIAEEVSIHVLDLQTMSESGPVFHSHKAFTSNDECFFIFLDVSDPYVARWADVCDRLAGSWCVWNHAVFWNDYNVAKCAHYPYLVTTGITCGSVHPSVGLWVCPCLITASEFMTDGRIEICILLLLLLFTSRKDLKCFWRSLYLPTILKVERSWTGNIFLAETRQQMVQFSLCKNQNVQIPGAVCLLCLALPIFLSLSLYLCLLLVCLPVLVGHQQGHPSVKHATVIIPLFFQSLTKINQSNGIRVIEVTNITARPLIQC